MVYSFNDYEGYGFHGDFFNGWEDGLMDVRIPIFSTILISFLVQQFLEYCRTHEDGWDTECGAKAIKQTGTCAWESAADYDEEEFTGAYDTLPPMDVP